MTASGSLSILPVRMPTTVASGSMTPASTSFLAPATEQHDAGSAPMPAASTIALASIISCSETSSTTPLLHSSPRMDFFQDTGLPILMAVAMVSGSLTALNSVCPCTCLLYTSDAADEEDSVDLGGRSITKKNNERKVQNHVNRIIDNKND
eukprot:TRINITY_DN7766_c0_g1_i2.p1 TRINITY_DN7766_c0_g1~~TRINITY_DN7766_c0_g1_i2.p1  ORF type:complete len:151 (+),score=17.66 TRINITY_DN7766_c0_g1_i2:66-518(+)